ncbi:MAG: hypothetical protein WAK17_10640 [Candidatus Nitrosopolaris sp.]
MVTSKVKCTICTRSVSNNQDKYCSHHTQAYDNLKELYKIWKKAFDGLSWIDYMNKLLELNETGSWVKEVISAEIRTASVMTSDY